MPQSAEEEEALRIKNTTGNLEMLDEKDRERVKNTHDSQMERAVDLLKGVLLYAQRGTASKAVSAAQ